MSVVPRSGAQLAAGQVPIPVATRGLSKAFGRLLALDSVDIDIPAGEVTALIGPNGAGKSTLVNLVSGLLLPTAGEVRFEGHSVTGMHPREIASLGVARTFQTPRLFPGFTALENVLLGHYGSRGSRWLGTILRSPAQRREAMAARAACMEWLAFAGLADIAHEEATSLPIGTQRLLEFVRALAAEPTVLLLDEPAAGLGPNETLQLGQLLQRVASSGPGVLLVEHDMGMVMSIADTVVVLDQGKRIAVGTASEVSRDPVVVHAYLGAEE